MSIFSRHTAYERLVTEHVDGVLDTAGEARLQQHLATCESCVVEMREQQAVRSLLRAEALVPATRSFALSYAPRQAAAGDSRVTAWLRPMQVATATAAVVLVALVGVSVVDQAGGERAPEADAQQMASAIENADKLDITRENARRHIAFGYGIHRCVGARLAELQLRVLMEEMHARRLRVNVAGDVERVRANFVEGFRKLEVEVTGF